MRGPDAEAAASESDDEDYEARGLDGERYRGSEDLGKEDEDDDLFNLSEEDEDEDQLIALSTTAQQRYGGAGSVVRDDRGGPPPPGRYEMATEQELEWLDLVEAVREQARAGDVHESILADAELASVALRKLPDSRLMGSGDAVVCHIFEEGDPRLRLPTDAEITAAVEWAAANVAGGLRRVVDAEQALRQAPPRIDRRCLSLLLQCRAELIAAYEMDDERALWLAVERGARARIDAWKARARAAAVKPRQNSAGIAVYNNTRQSHFAPPHKPSEATDDALRCCSLRPLRQDGVRAPRELQLGSQLALLACKPSRDSGSSSSDDEASSPVSSAPSRCCSTDTRGWLNMDLEGDVAAVAAVPEGSIGVFFPACATGEQVTVVRPPSLRGALPLGPILAEGGCDELSRPRSNPGNDDRVWVFATDRRDRAWLIEAYEARSRGSVVARLEFPLAFKSKFVTWRPTMTRCLDRIIAALGDSRLYVWSITDALADLETNAYAHARKKHRSASARRTSPPPLGSSAREMIVSDDVYWSVGDCQRLTDSAVCLAPAADSRYSSLRVFDARHERTVRLLAGHREATALGRQHCASSHDLVFSIELRTTSALVFDLRSASPAFVLPCCARLYAAANDERQLCTHQTGILGLPCAGHSCIAFTWAYADQCVRAWDLRRPAYHAYTLSAGNRPVSNLAWHAPSASLFLATTTHAHPRADQLDWPLDAAHSAEYFSHRMDLSHLPSRAILRYAFDDGRPLLDSRPKYPRAPAWP